MRRSRWSRDRERQIKEERNITHTMLHSEFFHPCYSKRKRLKSSLMSKTPHVPPLLSHTHITTHMHPETHTTLDTHSACDGVLSSPVCESDCKAVSKLSHTQHFMGCCVGENTYVICTHTHVHVHTLCLPRKAQKEMRG